MRITLLVWALLFGSLSCASLASELQFSSKNGATNLTQLEILKLPAVTVSVQDPTRGKRVEYTGIEINAVLTQQFGEMWNQASEIVFTCADGYQPSIPVSVLKQHRAILAYGQPGKPQFETIVRSNGQIVDPGPYYLVWDTDNDPKLSDEDWISWPWQITTIELLFGGERYPLAVPPTDSGDKVQKGFLAFRQHCIKCHSLNGEGTGVAPELNYPMSVTEYWQPEWLERFILNPQSVRYNSKMTAFYAGLANKEERVKEIVSYLKIMAQHKKLNTKQ